MQPIRSQITFDKAIQGSAQMPVGGLHVPDYSYPGVYVQEVPSAATPIAAASNSRAVFVGFTESGESGSAKFLSSWEEFQRELGGFNGAESFVAQAVFHYFGNGGRTCYVVSGIAEGASASFVDLFAASDTAGTDGPPTLTVRARSNGAWGDQLWVEVTDEADQRNRFRLNVWRGDGTADQIRASSPVEVFSRLSMDPSDERYVIKMLAQSSALVRAVDHASAPRLALARLIGEAKPIPVDLIPAGSFRLLVNGISYTVSVGAPADTTDRSLTTALAEALSLHPALGRPVPELIPADGKRALTLAFEPPSDATIDRLEVLPALEEVDRQTSYAQTLGLWPPSRVQFDTAYRSRTPAATTSPRRLTGGNAGVASGNILNQDGVKAALDRISDASLLVVPGRSAENSSALDYCDSRPLRDMFFVGDCLQPEANTTSALASIRSQVTDLPRNSMGALYFPWVLADDPSGTTKTPIPTPPSGFIAGVIVRTDTEKGVWRAPAGLVEGLVRGARGLTHYLTDEEQGPLNEACVNVLRKFDAAGIVCWGARTLTVDTSLRYVPVRRLQGLIQRSVYTGLQTAVFKPNTHHLWSSLKADVGAFLNSLFRAGAFQGETPREAYFVRCGLGETMTQTDIDLGKVVVDIGFAPVKPAEFVIVRVQHSVLV